MSHASILRGVVDSAGLGDLWEPARKGARLSRADLDRILSAGHPLAAAALADIRREASNGVVVTHPWTLRVRAPGVVLPAEPATLVSHRVNALDGIPATEAEVVGELPRDLTLGRALEIVRSVKVARPDLGVRALTANAVAALARSDGCTVRDAFHKLAGAGLASLGWRAGDGLDAVETAVHRAAHEAGLRTVAVLGYSKGRADASLLDRLEALRAVAEDTGAFLSVVCLPDRTEGASPLRGTAGTEDTLVCALGRLGLGHVLGHVTADAHAVGHKLAALLLSCGASDLVGAQAAAKWAPPTNDGPRPLNPDRIRRYVIEARRSPELRDALFDLASATTGA